VVTLTEVALIVAPIVRKKEEKQSKRQNAEDKYVSPVMICDLRQRSRDPLRQAHRQVAGSRGASAENAALAGEEKFVHHTCLEADVAEDANARRLPSIRSPRLALKGKTTEPVSDEVS
jgi:hypothetical protein